MRRSFSARDSCFLCECISGHDIYEKSVLVNFGEVGGIIDFILIRRRLPGMKSGAGIVFMSPTYRVYWQELGRSHWTEASLRTNHSTSMLFCWSDHFKWRIPLEHEKVKGKYRYLNRSIYSEHTCVYITINTGSRVFQVVKFRFQPRLSVPRRTN